MSRSVLPWVLVKSGEDDEIKSASGDLVHSNTSYYPTGISYEDAALIVHAVNLLADIAAGGMTAAEIVERAKSALE